VHRFFTPLLRRLYIFSCAFLLVYYSVWLVHHSSWNKERLYQRLLHGSQDDKLRAVSALIFVDGEGQLIRALKSRSPMVRQIAANSLLNLWSIKAGNKAHSLLESADQSIGRQAYADALATLTDAIDKYPKFAEAWNRRATLYWQLGKFKEAIEDCRTVVGLNPNHFAAWQGMGLCQVRLGDLNGACHSFRAALKINPHDRALQYLLLHCEDLLQQVVPEQIRRYDAV